MPEAIWTIYLLRDPENASIGYVGQTRQDPRRRLHSHMSHVKWSNGRLSSKRKAEWFASLRERSILPTIIVLDWCSTSEAANLAEKNWIRWARKGLNLDLVNSTAGGQGVYPFDFAERVSAGWKKPGARARKVAASREQMKRQWADPDFKEAMREKLRAAWQRPERIEKNKAAWRDPQKRAERIENIARANATEKTKAKRRISGQRAKGTPENRAKVAAEMRRRWADPDYKARVSANISRALLLKAVSNG